MYTAYEPMFLDPSDNPNTDAIPNLITSPGYFWHDATNTAKMPKIKIKKCQKLATLKVSFF